MIGIIEGQDVIGEEAQGFRDEWQTKRAIMTGIACIEGKRLGALQYGLNSLMRQRCWQRAEQRHFHARERSGLQRLSQDSVRLDLEIGGHEVDATHAPELILDQGALQ